jgi:hypothetical protein
MIKKAELIERFKKHRSFDYGEPIHEHLNFANMLSVSELGKIYNFRTYGVNPGFGLCSSDGYIDIPTSMLEKLAKTHGLPWLTKDDVKDIL